MSRQPRAGSKFTSVRKCRDRTTSTLPFLIWLSFGDWLIEVAIGGGFRAMCFLGGFKMESKGL
jgi:hypothetical protein